MIKAITFDLDGVYFTADSFRNFKNTLTKSVSNQSLVDQVFFRSDETLLFRKGEITEDAYWNFVKSTLGITLTNAEIFKLLADCYEVDPDVSKLVKTVRSHGYKTCICSNNFPTRIRQLDKKFNFLADFDVPVFSYQVGALKPDLKIYQALINQSGCAANEIVYSDDKLENVTAAQSVGVNAFVYQGFDHFIQALTSLGVTA